MAEPSNTTVADGSVDSESNTANIVGILGFFYVLAVVLVGLRLYARWRLAKCGGWDDVFVVLAALCSTAGLITLILQSHHGLGQHTSSITPTSLVLFNKISFFQTLISAIGGLASIRVSIALSLLRLSIDTRYKWYRRTLHALIGFIAVYTVLAWLTLFLRCRPLSAFWAPDESKPAQGPQCYSPALFIAFGVVNNGCNMFTDVMLALLPIPIVWQLESMPRSTRLYLVGIFGLGYLSIAMGISKAVYQSGWLAERDPTFRYSVQFYGFLQLQLGIVAASAPALRPLCKGCKRKRKAVGVVMKPLSRSTAGEERRPRGRSGDTEILANSGWSEEYGVNGVHAGTCVDSFTVRAEAVEQEREMGVKSQRNCRGQEAGGRIMVTTEGNVRVCETPVPSGEGRKEA